MNHLVLNGKKIWHRSTLHHFRPPSPLLMTFFFVTIIFFFCFALFPGYFSWRWHDQLLFFFCFPFNKWKKCQFIWHRMLLVQIKCQKQPPEVFVKKSVLKNFEKFTGKHLWQSLMAEYTPRKGNFKIYFSK